MLKNREQDNIKLIDFGLAKKLQGGRVRYDILAHGKSKFFPVGICFVK
jgi:hypothetical protein